MSEEITKDFEKIVPKGWKRYPRYKDSGVEWIGEIPEGWDLIKVKYLSEIKSGDFLPSVEMSSLFKYPVIGGNGVLGYSGKTNSHGECVVIGRVGAKCGNIHLVKESAWITDNALILKPSCAVSIGYLAYSLDSLHLNQFSSQNAQPLITGTQVKEALIAIPSLEEQRLIHLSLSNYLSKIDILISKKQRLIELLKEKRAAIISRAVTKGLDPNAPMKDSGVEWIGEIPEGWDVAKLKRVVNHVGRGISPKYAEKSSIAVINQACVYWEGISKDYLKYHEETDISELRKGLLKKGDLLLNSTGTGTLGRALLFNLDRVCIADSHVTIVRCNRKLMIPSFLRLVVETSLYQSKILNELVAGSTNQIELSREKLRNLIVVLPHIEEQERIVAYATERNHKLDSFISKIEKSIELLKEYRSALITAAVTGKIDVREEVP